MANQITTELKNDQFINRAKEAVRNAYAEAIPDEMFHSLVVDEVKAFFETEDANIEVELGSYNRPETLKAKAMTPFRAIVWGEVLKLVQNKLDEAMRSNALKAEVMSSYTLDAPNTAELSDFWVAHMERLLPVMMKSMFSSAFASVIEQARMGAKMELMDHLNDRHS